MRKYMSLILKVALLNIVISMIQFKNVNFNIGNEVEILLEIQKKK